MRAVVALVSQLVARFNGAVDDCSLHCQRTCAHGTTIYRWPAGCAADPTARH
jgi:hypothetical protein